MKSGDTNLSFESRVGAFKVLDSVVGDGVDVHGVRSAVGSLDEARGIWAGNEAKSAESHFQFRAGAKVEFGESFATAVNVGGHRDDGGGAGFQGVDVAQVVAVAMILLVVHVEPAVVANIAVVAQPLANVGVFPSAGCKNTGYNLGESAEPNGVQELLEDGHISVGLTCFHSDIRHVRSSSVVKTNGKKLRTFGDEELVEQLHHTGLHNDVDESGFFGQLFGSESVLDGHVLLVVVVERECGSVCRLGQIGAHVTDDQPERHREHNEASAKPKKTR